MTPSEAQKLLTAASAFDNRDPNSEAVARLWAEALADIPGDADAFAAVARFYSEPARDGDTGRRWVEPHHIRTWRKRIRAERLGETIPAYDLPRPDETGAEFVRRRREQLRAIADGRLDAVPVRQLTGGPARDVQRALEGAARRVDEVLDEKPYLPAGFRAAVGMHEVLNELRIACPKAGCPATARQPCLTPRGARRTDTHQARKDAWAELKANAENGPDAS